MLDLCTSPPLVSLALSLVCALGAQEPDGASSQPSLSAQGRFVAFSSWAGNLVPGDTNDLPDIFVRDRETGSTARVSIRVDGTELNGGSLRPCISADGRWVAFESSASNLIGEDHGLASDIVVHDRATGRTVRASTGLDGAEGKGDSRRPAIAGGGRYVVFESAADNLVPGDENGKIDVFLYDLSDDSIQLVSGGNKDCVHASISADGRYIAYSSEASNIAESRKKADYPFDFNDRSHVFLHDRGTGATRYVSDVALSSQVYGGFYRPLLSGDGRIVAYDHRDSRLNYTLWIPFATVWAEGEPGRVLDPPVTGGPRLSVQGISADGSRVVLHSKNGLFVWSRSSRAMQAVDLGSKGVRASSVSPEAAISPDGRFVAFSSVDGELVEEDHNGKLDVFVRDLEQGSTERVSLPSR